MRFLSLLFLLGLVAACGRAADTTYSYSPPSNPGGRLCVSQCLEAQTYCDESCTLKNRACSSDVQAQALKDYDSYTRQQFIDRGPIEFHPRDFERMAPCDEAKKSCADDCQSHYRSCYQNCGGSIDENSSCRFLCF